MANQPTNEDLRSAIKGVDERLVQAEDRLRDENTASENRLRDEIKASEERLTDALNKQAEQNNKDHAEVNHRIDGLGSQLTAFVDKWNKAKENSTGSKIWNHTLRWGTVTILGVIAFLVLSGFKDWITSLGG